MVSNRSRFFYEFPDVVFKLGELKDVRRVPVAVEAASAGNSLLRPPFPHVSVNSSRGEDGSDVLVGTGWLAMGFRGFFLLHGI